jgi:hypothetical protein
MSKPIISNQANHRPLIANDVPGNSVKTISIDNLNYSQDYGSL